ncbi:ribonuclease H-like domain-containing protein [Tanacetum coccineum]
MLVTTILFPSSTPTIAFTSDNNCTIEFDAFGFFVKDFLTCHILFRCDSSGDLYPVTKPSTTHTAFLSTSASMWHQRLGHPGDEVLRSLVSRQFISYSLHNDFDMTDLGVLNYFLGISTTLTPTFLFLSQKKYALQLLERAHMVNCNPSQTPVDTSPKLVQQICLYMHNPREPHFAALKRILRYVAHPHAGLLQVIMYFWVIIFCRGQLNISTFSLAPVPKAEYRGVANVVAETAWLRNLLCELHSPLSTATLIYCDNVSAVYMPANPVQHQRTKHIEIDIHFVRDMVTAGQVRVLQVPSRYQYADIFTKGLPSALFEDFRSSLSVRPSPAQTVGAYKSIYLIGYLPILVDIYLDDLLVNIYFRMIR